MITFTKYQGTGNDFILIDDREKVFPSENIELINTLCDRRFGIGADGLILLQHTEDGHFYMQYFNRDGRESSMCGNGGRCFARFILDQGLAQKEIKFLAVDGWHQANLCYDSSHKEEIALQMIQVTGVSLIDANTFELNTGSPHYVRFIESSVTDFDLINEAKKIRYNPPYVLKGINVNYLNLLGIKEIKLRTYERGVEDETLSCGTGATAAAMSTAIFNNLPAGKHQLKVEVMGGVLNVKFHFFPLENRFEDVWLIGPAKKVFEGVVSV
ncbi:MAG: diaminopimelate epimerase [Bacteroidetes bacterium B1(2017)]|nr:MAG: diaminopimelate epimerase [Bacteroidetes bacterium B1(2017)]